jgi:hypothetical protein
MCSPEACARIDDSMSGHVAQSNGKVNIVTVREGKHLIGCREKKSLAVVSPSGRDSLHKTPLGRAETGKTR